MRRHIVYLREVASSLGEAVGARLEAEAAFSLLTLDVAQEGGALTVEPDRVVWEGVDLLQASVVVVEKPVFAWPQAPVAEPEAPEGPGDSVAARWRETSALLLSALHATALRVPVLPAPAVARLACSPFACLDRLARHAIPVHGYLLTSTQASSGSVTRDVCGSDLAHRPGAPGDGDARILLDPGEGEILDVLAIGGRGVLAGRYPTIEAWAADGDPAPLEGSLSPEVQALVHAVAVDLSLEFVRIAVAPEKELRVVWVDAGPDLGRLDRIHGGRVADLLARHFLEIASGRKGALHP
jgi:hypothetical protein